jgi:5-oxoprolinase (ATP-hydrolysing)
MRSDGSLCLAADLRAPDAVLSGPAGGVLAVAAVAAQAGFRSAVGLDMGGTSTDVCRVDVGDLPRREADVRVAGVRVRRAQLEVDTIAAGGGSILRREGVGLSVGPDSAGADPGPACYGRGGPPTLTDACLIAGLIDPNAFSPPLDASLVDLPGDAEEFLALARETMAAAVSGLATARGISLVDHALVAYGGAAGQHAANVAERLGISTVIFHPCAGVLCAWGQALARREETAVVSLWCDLAGSWEALGRAWQVLEEALPTLGLVERTVGLRHRGTDHALQVTGDSPHALRDAFEAAHLRRYGFDRPGVPIEIVNARVRVLANPPALPMISTDPWSLGDRVVQGPAVILAPTTAIQVPTGWEARRRNGLLCLTLLDPAVLPDVERVRSAFGVALWGNRFAAVASQAGEVLRRLARSVNVRERLDFSVALFDESGHLVANAPHIPVHLGAMGETVRDFMAHHPVVPGRPTLCNDPDAGGSHLPDLTVITPVAIDDAVFFVASRAHHVDVGGLTPGSMPPHSRTLADEGFVARHVPLLDPTGQALAPLDALLAQCRQPDTVRADLEAQIACNAHAARLLARLGSADRLRLWMAHLGDAADEAVLALLGELKPGIARDRVDGIDLVVRWEPFPEKLRVDLRGTGGPHPGNLNAPRAVGRAAVLYVLRTLLRQDIPLNDGVLRSVELLLPPNSIVDPPPGVAVVGGNVETSQRLVDLLLLASGARAASQGTMNNLTLGGEGWSFYETLAGGGGASAAGPGPSATQVHMTNTRGTDPEILEARLPLRVRQTRIRLGSGGLGRHDGGDGMVRELEVLVPCTVSLLAGRRRRGAPGLAGGGAGQPGRDWLIIAGKREPWDGASRTLDAGDRVRIETPGGGGWGQAETKPLKTESAEAG